MSKEYRLVKGKLPRKIEIGDWSAQKIVALLRMFDLFVEDGRAKITQHKRTLLEDLAKNDTYIDELLTRIDMPTSDPEATQKKFLNRFMGMIRVVLGWLKSHPHAVVDDIKKFMEKNPRCHWALAAFKTEVTAIGAEVVVMDQHEDSDITAARHSPNVTNVRGPEAMYNQALLQATGILTDLMKGLTATQIAKIAPSERIRLANQMLGTLGKTFKDYKPNNFIFNKINIHQAGREDLERAFLDYNDKQTEENES